MTLSSVLSRLLPLRARVRRSSRWQQRTFTAIHDANAWGNDESVSGSTIARGADFQHDLLSLLDAFAVRSLLDVPCGDVNWMREVLAARSLDYTGADIVGPLILRNTRLHAVPERRFLCLDMTRDDLPRADLILCRDGLVHLSFADARAALRNFRRSQSRFLLTTTFIGRRQNRDVATGGWRTLNLEAAPFRLPPPLAVIDERCLHSEGIYRDKRLGLWRLETIDV
jgi:hypothetical protein